MAENNEQALRIAIVATARRMQVLGLSPGRSGNVSARTADGFVVTPSGLPFDTLRDADIVALDSAGVAEAAGPKASSEWPMHRAIYAARPDAQAIVHCHSGAATALACAGLPMPAFHYMVAVAGGDDIPLCPYEPFGSAALADAVIHTLRGRRACLLAHHGQVVIGADLAAALELAEIVEWLAEVYCRVLATGELRVLSAEQMAAVARQFGSYGQPG